MRINEIISEMTSAGCMAMAPAALGAVQKRSAPASPKKKKKKAKKKVNESGGEMPYEKFPKIGWWLDKDVVRFYHGTHKKNLEWVKKNGIVAPTEGDTKGWVSLALEPNTAKGYASMSGGETNFRAAGASASHVDEKDRVIFVVELPQSYFRSKMAPARGNMANEIDKLTDKSKYEAYVKTPDGKRDGDQMYYAKTEIRMPKEVPAEYIKGFMRG